MTVGAYEAKTTLPRLLDEVAAGATIVITKHGRPVARLAPVRSSAREADLPGAFLAARKGKTLGSGLRAAIEDGRR